MLVAVIAPYNHLTLSKYGGLQFLLAHKILENDEYADFYARMDTYKMMDNGAFELGTSLPIDKVLEAAELVGANEIIAPDKPDDPDESYEMTKQFIEEMVDADLMGMYKIHAVPHGPDTESYLENFRKIVKLSPDVIGFSILDLWKWNPRLRPYVIRALDWFGELKASIEYHLLGLDDPLELLLYEGLPIRSVDTSLPITCAVWGDELSYGSRIRVTDNAQLSTDQLNLAVQNIATLLDTAVDFGRRGSL